MKSLWRKILVNLFISERYCPNCGGDVVAQGYHYIECQDCNQLTWLEEGNLGVDGKSHLYTGKERNQ